MLEAESDLEAFSHALLHDLRAPLRSICGYAELVLGEDGAALGPRGRNHLERVTKAASRLDSLIQDVLTLYGVHKARIVQERVNLEELLRTILIEHRDFRRAAADVHVQRPLLSMRGHPALLHQCVSHLLDNALKFVERGVKAKIRVWTESCGSDVRLWIEDNGIGIPKDSQDMVFGIFYRTHQIGHYAGTGVGLAIVSRGINRMGGTVGVESELGKGSRFWIQLPGAD